MDEATSALLAAYPAPWLGAVIWTQMNSRTRIAQLQKQLDKAKAMEMAAMRERSPLGNAVLGEGMEPGD